MKTVIVGRNGDQNVKHGLRIADGINCLFPDGETVESFTKTYLGQKVDYDSVVIPEVMDLNVKNFLDLPEYWPQEYNKATRKMPKIIITVRNWPCVDLMLEIDPVCKLIVIE